MVKSARKKFLDSKVTSKHKDVEKTSPQVED